MVVPLIELCFACSFIVGVGKRLNGGAWVFDTFECTLERTTRVQIGKSVFPMEPSPFRRNPVPDRSFHRLQVLMIWEMTCERKT